MKIKKVRNVGILLIIAIFSFSSCSLIFNENVDADLSELAAFASGLDTAVRMIAIDADVEVTSRTVNADTYTYDGGSVIIQNSPYDTYEALNSGGTNLIDIPGSNKYLQNFYGNPALTAKFSMKPVGDYYEIKL